MVLPCFVRWMWSCYCVDVQLCLRCVRDSKTAGAGRVTPRWATCCWAGSGAWVPPPHVVWWGLRWSVLHMDRWDLPSTEKDKIISVRSVSWVFMKAIWFCLMLKRVLLFLHAKEPHPEEHVQMKNIKEIFVMVHWVSQTFPLKYTKKSQYWDLVKSEITEL